MINGKELSRCIDILAELNANASSRRDKELILELGYIIKQELVLVKSWESNHNEQTFSRREQIDVNKLLEDNAQLYKENETLVENLAKLKDLVQLKLPSVEKDLTEIGEKFNVLNRYMENSIGY